MRFGSSPGMIPAVYNGDGGESVRRVGSATGAPEQGLIAIVVICEVHF